MVEGEGEGEGRPPLPRIGHPGTVCSSSCGSRARPHRSSGASHRAARDRLRCSTWNSREPPRAPDSGLSAPAPECRAVTFVTLDAPPQRSPHCHPSASRPPAVGSRRNLRPRHRELFHVKPPRVIPHWGGAFPIAEVRGPGPIRLPQLEIAGPAPDALEQLRRPDRRFTWNASGGLTGWRLRTVGAGPGVPPGVGSAVGRLRWPGTPSHPPPRPTG